MFGVRAYVGSDISAYPKYIPLLGSHLSDNTSFHL
jgi:hypothetical protein